MAKISEYDWLLTKHYCRKHPEQLMHPNPMWTSPVKECPICQEQENGELNGNRD
jgi:hypothetical protein